MTRKPDIEQVDFGIIAEPGSLCLSNGIKVFLIGGGTEDIVRLEFSFQAGHATEQIPLLASSTNLMLTEGSQNFTAIKINRVMDLYGAFYNLYCDRDRAGIVIWCMNRHLDKVLELTHEILFAPVFPEKELNALMKKRLRSFQISRDKVNVMAGDRFFESIFGSHHPYGRETHPDDFKAMIPSLLKDYHAGFYTAGNMAIIVSGKVQGNISDLLENKFGAVRTPPVYNEESHIRLSGQKEKKVYIGKTGSVQTAVKIGSASINKRHPDYPALKILNMILGGYFGSRLMKNIREEKGYTYGITSSVTSLSLSGYKMISTEVSKIITQNAIDEIYKEIRLLQTVPLESEELDMVRNCMLGDMVRMFDGPFATAESFRSAWEFGLDNSYFYRLAEKIKSIEPDEITSIAQTYYNIDDLYEITAG
jgi:predicted Zn-dependent peptidase